MSLLTAILLVAAAQPPAQIVQSQVEAYNRHDLAGFTDTYADDIRIYRIRADTAEPSITGKDQLREFYRTERFNRPALRAEILHRTVLGNKVIDHERITGLADQPVEAEVVYAIANGHIAAVWIFTAS